MKRRISLTAILLAFVMCVCVSAQEKNDVPKSEQKQVPDSPPDLDTKEIEKVLADLDEDSSLDDAQKKSLKEKLNSVLKLVEDAGTLKQNAADFAKSIEESPKKAEQYRQSLANLPTVKEAETVDSGYKFDSLRDELNEATVIQEAKTKELNSQSTKLSSLETRPVEIIARLPAARKILADSRAAYEESKKNQQALSRVQQADRWVQQATWLRAANEIAMLQAEQLSQRPREAELEAQIDFLKREVENTNARVKALNRLLSEEISSDIERFRTIANDAKALLPEDPAVQDLSKEVLALADYLATVSVNVRLLSIKGSQLKTRVSDLEKEYQSIKEELSLGSGGIEMAQVLIELSRRLQGQPVPRDDLMSVEQARLIWFEARKRDRKKEELEKQFENYPALIRELVAVHGEALDRLRVESNDLTADLSELQLVWQNYSKLRFEIQGFVSQKLFGFEIRSSPVIGLQTLTNMPAGIWWLFSTTHYQELGHEFNLNGALLFVVLIIFALLIVFRPFFKRRLQKINEQTHRISTDYFGLTLRALACTIALAAPLPVLWFPLAWVMTHSSIEYQWMVGLNFASLQLFVLVIVTMLFREVARPDGIGIKHFKWSESSAAVLRSKLFWMLIGYLPLMLITSCFVYGEGAEYFASVGRVAFILAHLSILIAFNPLKYLKRRRVESELVGRLDGQIHWLKAVAKATVISCNILVLLACLGFMMTSLYLSVLLANTGAILMISRLAYCLVHRWLEIRRRKLAVAAAIAERKARREAELESEEDDESKNVQEDLGIDEEEELKLDLETAGEQSQRIMRLVFNVATAIAIYIYWSTAFPLTRILDKTNVPLFTDLSLFQLAQACLVLFVSIVLIRNLPGLIEFVLLSRTRIEVGTRKAIHTLAQYGLCAVTIVVLSNILEWDWSKLGWLAAALSVGLGFGLQEIVANFVCGIILLFERPIRIGDVVSLSGNTGVVSKIHLRATVITDWDRQEIVVPNKNLITGTIFNWTLSAKLNRVVVPIGVVHGTDTEKATQIMMDVAANHPDVIDDPPPTAHFTGFGQGSLDLVLRAFLEDRDNRENAITSLHTEINRRFEEEGIKIALPQRQMHVVLDD